MRTTIIPSVRILIFFTILTGILYPVGITVIALGLFPYQANGSMIERNGRVVGSELIGQGFAGDRYFHPRPSAIAYDPVPSGGSNWGPTDVRMADSVSARRDAFIRKNGVPGGVAVPKEMLFASGSGVDPHISPDAALLQADRVAAARGFDSKKSDALKELVLRSAEPPQFALFGEPRINVLKLNLALDAWERGYPHPF